MHDIRKEIKKKIVSIFIKLWTNNGFAIYETYLSFCIK
jgi:hypothetical protein